MRSQSSNTYSIRSRISKLRASPVLYLRLLNLDPLIWIRWISLHVVVIFFPLAKKTFLRNKKYFFNLDCHISVIREISRVADENDARVISWSISKHNHITRKYFKFPDPVAIVGANTWKLLSSQRIRRFQFIYGIFLRSFDGFIVTYPTAFTQLFLKFEKPILVICPTRYEIPYTDNPDLWKSLNLDLRDGISSGLVTLFVNSEAEKKYLKYYTGIESEVVHTVCDYITSKWSPKSADLIFFSRSHPLSEQIIEETDGIWQEASQFLGPNYSWEKLMSVAGVFILPYNNNTMHFFELANAGVPVVVPSKDFLMRLWNSSVNSGVMSEISNFKVFSISTSGLADEDPSNYLSPVFKNYWINLCDFYDYTLMPNVSVIDSFSELLSFKPNKNLRSLTDLRNERLRLARSEAIAPFFRRA